MERIISPKLPTLLGNFCKGVKIIHFLVKSYLGNFYKHWRFLSVHTADERYEWRQTAATADKRYSIEGRSNFQTKQGKQITLNCNHRDRGIHIERACACACTYVY